MSDLALHLGVIGERTRHDLRKYSTLRDRYAHDRARSQLYVDHEMYAHLKSTYLYRENVDFLATEKHQGALFLIYHQLKEVVQSGVVE